MLALPAPPPPPPNILEEWILDHLASLQPGVKLYRTNTVSVLGGDKGYTVKYSPDSEGLYLSVYP